MKRLVASSLVVASLMGLAVDSAEATSEQYRPGSAFVRARGNCSITKQDGIAHTRCRGDHWKRIFYKFRVPRDAYTVGVSVKYNEHETCCGFTRVSFRRPHRRLVVAIVRVKNYGNPIGLYISSIRRVTVHFETP